MPVWGPPWKHLAAEKKPGGHSKDLKDLIWQEPCGLGVGNRAGLTSRLVSVGGGCGRVFSIAGEEGSAFKMT